MDGIGGFRGMTKTLLPIFAFVGVMTILAGLVLLVGCANIAGLLLGRGAARRREIGVRLALGAGRGRLIRQLLTESLLLALVGGAAGIVLALWLGGSINALIGQLPVAFELDLGLDRRTLGYTLVVSLITAVLCGLAPAKRATRMSVLPALKEDDAQPQRQRLRHWLVVGQVGLSCALLLWGGLFARSLLNAHRIDPGFEPAGVVLAQLQLDEEAIKSGASVALLRDLQSRIGAIPGVESQGLAKIIPLALLGREEMKMRTETDSRDRPGRWVLVNRVTTEWFRTVRIPLLAGRDFTADDRPGSPRCRHRERNARERVLERRRARQAPGRRGSGRRRGRQQDTGRLAKPSGHLVYTAYAQRPETEVELFVRTSDIGGHREGAAHGTHAARPDEVRRCAADDRRGQRGTRARAGRRGPDRRLRHARRAARDDGDLRPRRVRASPSAHARSASAKPSAPRHPTSSGSSSPAARFQWGSVLWPALVSARSAPSASAASSWASRPIDPLTMLGTTVLVVGTTLAASALPALRAARVESVEGVEDGVGSRL